MHMSALEEGIYCIHSIYIYIVQYIHILYTQQCPHHVFKLP